MSRGLLCCAAPWAGTRTVSHYHRCLLFPARNLCLTQSPLCLLRSSLWDPRLFPGRLFHLPFVALEAPTTCSMDLKTPWGHLLHLRKDALHWIPTKLPAPRRVCLCRVHLCWRAAPCARWRLTRKCPSWMWIATLLSAWLKAQKMWCGEFRVPCCIFSFKSTR